MHKYTMFTDQKTQYVNCPYSHEIVKQSKSQQCFFFKKMKNKTKQKNPPDPKIHIGMQRTYNIQFSFEKEHI